MMKVLRIMTVAAFVPLLAHTVHALETWGRLEPIRREDAVLETLKHRITVAESGLPEQLFIKPAEQSLPLYARDLQYDADDALLTEAGRGNVLRNPVRLEAVVEGVRREAEIIAPARITAESAGAVSYASTLQLGTVRVELITSYECDGSFGCKISYQSEEQVELLELILDIRGPLTHAYRGLVSDFRPDAYERGRLDVRVPEDTEMVVWSSLKEWTGVREPFVNYLYFGSLDRGFTWLCDSNDGFMLDAGEAMAQIERDPAGQATVRFRLVNAPVEDVKAGLTFSLLTHPALPRPEGVRRTQWLGWREAPDLPDGAERVSPTARSELRNALIAGEPAMELGGLGTGALESAGAQVELKRFAGADFLSPEADNARLYPMSLFAVMAGPQRGLPARVRPNIREVIPAGERPSYDNQVIGRAILHDIGVAVEGLRQPVEFLRTIDILEEFGFFEEDVEVLPYWRNRDLIRYGEPWDADDEFALTGDDPAANVYVTAYRRPLERDGKQGYQALIVVYNDGDESVKQRMYVLDPDRVFGGRNRADGAFVAGRDTYDFSIMPPESDWGRQAEVDEGVYEYSVKLAFMNQGRGAADWLGRGERPPALLDFADDGMVIMSVSRYEPPPEIYGPLFVYPRDFRILYGFWLED